MARRIDFSKAKKAAKYRFVSVLYMNLNNVGTSISISYLKHFQVSVSQVKKSKCLGLAKKNASLPFSQSLAFTIHRPLLNCCMLHEPSDPSGWRSQRWAGIEKSGVRSFGTSRFFFWVSTFSLSLTCPMGKGSCKSRAN